MTVTVVGSANLDVVAQVPRIPGPGETLQATAIARGAGGKGANQAVAAALAGGAKTWFVGQLGDDDDGALLRRSLSAAGVRLDGVETSGEATGTALISVSHDGENVIVVAGGANADFTRLTRRQKTAIGEASVVLAQLEVPVETVLAAARARAGGARFLLNAAPSHPLPADLLELVDVLVVNEHELADLSGGAPLEEALTGIGSQVAALVVTLGSRGSMVLERGRRTELPAIAVTAVDTTGAGDTFCGVLAARLAAGDDLVGAARWGTVAASLAVQRPGAQDAVPTVAELAARIKLAGTPLTQATHASTTWSLTASWTRPVG